MSCELLVDRSAGVLQPAGGTAHVFGSGGPGGVGITRQDGLDDGPVLLPHRGPVLGFERLVETCDGHGGTQVLCQVAQQTRKLRVAGGICDTAVKGQVLLHCRTARGH